MEREGSEVHRAAMAAMTAWLDVPVMQNVIRSAYVEFQIGVLLGDEWDHVGKDWGGWDFERDGVRLEIKQSAARQTWNLKGGASKPSFDIAPRTGYFDGLNWVDEPGRHADIYVFAWHDVVDESCDQRDERQWRYFVASKSKLPPGRKTIAWSSLRTCWLGETCGVEADANTLLQEVDRLAASTDIDDSSV